MARKLWDGNDSTFPKGGSLGTTRRFLAPTRISFIAIYDLNGDGDGD